MANTYLTRTPSSSGNRKTFTFSFWFKRGSLGSNQYIYTQYNSSNSYNSAIYLGSSDNFLFWDYTNAYQLNLRLNRLFRDVNAWYHIVIAVDTTQATASNRAKIYINGVQETSFSTATYPSQNLDLRINEYQPQQIGISRYGSTNENFFDGSMSHFHFIDGTAYPASAFGSTDSTTGEWKINTSPSVTYGTNGYFILKDSGSKTDQSGKGNNFSEEGSPGIVSNTQDCPSNVFATWNPLFPAGGSLTFNNGNTKLVNTGTAAYRTSVSTLGASTGKYYAEFKCGGDTFFTGVLDINNTKMGINDINFGSSSDMTAYGYGIFNSTGNVMNNGSTVVSNYTSAINSDAILCVALDCDNKKLYFRKNNDAWGNSGNPTSGSTGTGAISLASGDRTWVFASSVNGVNINANFGNGYQGTTAVSSAGTNASNNGIFEYDVPTGYTALSTKGLNL